MLHAPFAANTLFYIVVRYVNTEYYYYVTFTEKMHELSTYIS